MAGLPDRHAHKVLWMLINMMWLLTAGSIAGVILNIKRKRSCFIIWGITNAAWVWVDLDAGLYAQAVLFAVYFALAVWGYFAWK
jgi:nicotinamide riboside transporter PnuC